MNNMFENAYFGKAYKTRDGRKAIYLFYAGKQHLCINESFGTSFFHNNNGTVHTGIIPKEGDIDDLDIVSEWQEEISEEELDKAFNDYIADERTKCGNDKDVYRVMSVDNVWLKEGFKAGYRKALEQYESK